MAMEGNLILRANNSSSKREGGTSRAKPVIVSAQRGRERIEVVLWRDMQTHIVVNQGAPTADASVVPASRRQPSPIAGHRQACHSERSEESRRGCSAVNPESEPAIRRSPAHPIVSSSAVDAREYSEIPSSLCFSEKIGNNIHKHNNLPPHGAPEILIGTQNHSPEDSTS